MVTKLDLEYGELKWSPLEASFANARIRSYLVALAAAMKEEEDGTAVIVYIDESYIHQGQRTKYSWYCKNSEKKNTYQGHGPNSGKRIIVLHAMTKDGMLTMPDVDPSNILSVVNASKFSADRKDGGPTMAGIRDAVKTYLLSHPGMNTTVPRQLMDDANFTLIYTPPYESWLQPIELVWAKMKHTVSTQAFHGRTHQETAAQTYASFDRINGALCSSLLSHVRKLMDSWLKSDAAGSLQRFESMSAMMTASKAEIEAIHDLYVEDSAVVRDKQDKEDDEEE